MVENHNPPIGGENPPSRVDAYVEKLVRENPSSTGRGKRGRLYSVKQIAKMTDQKVRTMERVVAITRRGGIPELMEAMGKGLVSAAAAAEIARFPGREYQLLAIEHKFTAKRAREVSIKNGWLSETPEETLRREAVRLAESLYHILNKLEVDPDMINAVVDVYKAMKTPEVAS